ncbi:MAG: Na-translocating system protein MpsC family protein [Chitinophagales bacterium]
MSQGYSGLSDPLKVSTTARSRLAVVVASVLRRNIGKGPLTVRVVQIGNRVEITIAGCLTPLEHFLVQCGEGELVEQIRQRLVQPIMAEVAREMTSESDSDLEDWRTVWHNMSVENNTQTIILEACSTLSSPNGSADR